MRKNKAYFEKNYFANYDEQDGNGWGFNWRASQKKRMENAVRFMGKTLKKKDLTVLEAGCATADMTRLIYENIDSIKRYDAFDISDIAIKICKTKGMDQINWMVCDLTDMNFIPNTYDLIICSEAIAYLSFDQQKVCIEKFYSYLKRGGVLFLSMHDDEYGEIFKPVLKCFRKKKIFYNKTWLWTKIEYQLFRCYRQSNKKIFRRLLRLLISNEKLMEFFNKINEIFLPNKIQHIFLLLKK